MKRNPSIHDSIALYEKNYVKLFEDTYKQILPLKFFNYVFKAFHTLFDKIIYESGNIIEDPKKKFVDADRLYDHFFSYVNFLVKDYSREVPLKLPSNYTKSKPTLKPKGVAVRAFFVSPKDEYYEFYSAHSYQISSDTQTPEIVQKNILNLRSLASNSNSPFFRLFSNFGSKSGYEFHAEEAWFAINLPTLILQIKDFLKQEGNLKELKDLTDEDLRRLFNLSSEAKTAFDSNPLAMLKRKPRFEFEVSSECCLNCYQHFKDFRTFLNRQNIYLPIIIYSDYPYNTEQVRKGHSGLAVVDFSGHVRSLDVYTKTLYNTGLRKIPGFDLGLSVKQKLHLDVLFYATSASLVVENTSQNMSALVSLFREIFIPAPNSSPNIAIVWLKEALSMAPLNAAPPVKSLLNFANNYIHLLGKFPSSEIPKTLDESFFKIFVTKINPEKVLERAEKLNMQENSDLLNVLTHLALLLIIVLCQSSRKKSFTVESRPNHLTLI